MILEDNDGALKEHNTIHSGEFNFYDIQYIVNF